MEVITEQKATFGVKPTCRALGVARVSYYRCLSSAKSDL